ncbi:hypothetical protein CPB83DRAFT_831629 [Crepidotus variabilis]|uniref:Uncharacterized protein n=1 Tax=Crepidotus variabilis TaxID=179855 RepID=A0A9P6ERU6_9AGAR|nr:hypothetical protein CPB83DRAFT_831629 [Crepidotus variabilis]
MAAIPSRIFWTLLVPTKVFVSASLGVGSLVIMFRPQLNVRTSENTLHLMPFNHPTYLLIDSMAKTNTCTQLYDRNGGISHTFARASLAIIHLLLSIVLVDIRSTVSL